MKEMTLWIRALFVALVVLCLNGCSKSVEQTFFSCALKDGLNQVHQYSFEFNPSKSYLFWVDGTQELKVIRNTESQLWGEHSGKYHEFPYDKTSFQLNRITGDAEMFYSRKLTTEEESTCKKTHGIGCGDNLVLAEHSESGHCQTRDRKI